MTPPSPRRFYEAAWPPIVALVGSVLVFVTVLAVTPPGVSAPLTLLLGQPRDPRVPEAAYAAGAAASLAVITLVVLAASCSLVEVLRRAAAARPNGRGTGAPMDAPEASS